MSFAEAVKPAEAVIALYKRIPLSALPDFTDGQLNAIQGQANADYSYFKQILDFDATASGAATTRTNLLDQLRVRRDQLFVSVWPRHLDLRGMAPDHRVYGERGGDDREGSDDASRALAVRGCPRHLVRPAHGRDVRATRL